MPGGSEFHTVGAATLKPCEAKVVRTRGTDSRLDRFIYRSIDRLVRRESTVVPKYQNCFYIFNSKWLKRLPILLYKMTSHCTIASSSQGKSPLKKNLLVVYSRKSYLWLATMDGVAVLLALPIKSSQVRLFHSLCGTTLRRMNSVR